MGKEMSTVRVSRLEDGFHQKDIINKYMEDENGEGNYSEYSDIGEASEQC